MDVIALSDVGKVANRKFVGSQVIMSVLFKQTNFSHLGKMTIESSKARKKGAWSPHGDIDLILVNMTFDALFGIQNILSKDNQASSSIADHLTEFAALFGLSISRIFFYFPTIIRKHYIDKITVGFVKNLSHSSIVLENKKSNGSVGDKSFTLFDEIHQSIKNDQSKNSIITNEILLVYIFSLLAGTDTSTTTLELCVLFDHEDNSNDSGDCDIQYTNTTHSHCIKFEAFIHEVLRVFAIVSKNIALGVSETCVLKFNYAKDNNGIKKYDAVNGSSIIFDKLRDYCLYNYDKGERCCEYIIDSFDIDPNLDYVMTQDINIWGKNASKLDNNHSINKISKRVKHFLRIQMHYHLAKKPCKHKFTCGNNNIDNIYEHGDSQRQQGTFFCVLLIDNHITLHLYHLHPAFGAIVIQKIHLCIISVCIKYKGRLLIILIIVFVFGVVLVVIQRIQSVKGFSSILMLLHSI